MFEYILYAHVHTGFTIKMPLGDMVAANRIYRPPIKSINIYPKAKSLHVRFISIEKYLVTTQSLYICIKNTSKYCSILLDWSKKIRFKPVKTSISTISQII